MKVSRKLIAERAGVSKTTVTRVLAGFPSISEETRSRVMSVINELGYTQNKLAGNLSRNQNSSAVAMLVPDMTNYYYLEMFDRTVSLLENLDYTVSIYKVSSGNFFRMMDKIISNRVTAIINLAFIPIGEEYLKKAKSANIKIIHPGIHDDPVKINVDYSGAMQQCFSSLQAAGCTCFRFLCGADKSFLADGRIQSFLHLMKESGREGDDCVIWGNYPDVSALNVGYRLMGRMLEDTPELDAVFCLNDMMALGAIKAIRESGRKVGRDVSVVGFDNILLSEYFIPSLTTIDSDNEKETRLYVDYILGKKKGDPDIVSRYIPRSSTRKKV